VSAAFPVDSTIENLEFLDESKVGANEAAGRAGFASAEALEKWLERHDAYDLWLSFKKRDPVGYHSQEQRRDRATAAKADPMIAVLDAADESARAATRRKAEKVRTLLSELRSAVAAERAEDQQKVEARKEIERLQLELVKAKARLRSGSTTLTVAGSVSAAELRKWAQSQGIACPSTGRVPNAVREAYESTEAAS
jgi:hypothetical protein